MEVRNHRIDEIWHAQTSNLSPGTITPTVLVTHYTTGWSDTANRDWLLGRQGGHPGSEVSAHVVVGRDGTAWQIAPFNRRAWHAGPSRFGSLTDLNTHSIGIEFCNPGWLKPNGANRWVDYHGNRRSSDELEDYGGFIESPHPRVGSATYAWPLFTDAQVAKGLEIARAIVAKYDIRAVVTHEEIDTRGWKTDPGPAFEQHQRAFVDLLDSGEAEPARVYAVNATRLNLRGGPGTGYDTIDPPGHLPRGTRVTIIRQDGNWGFVEVSDLSQATDSPAGLAVGLRGWVNRDYLDLIF
jgi:N-acetylmuramoyl-L-alanine amidase